MKMTHGGQVTSCLGGIHAGLASSQIATPIQADETIGRNTVVVFVFFLGGGGGRRKEDITLPKTNGRNPRMEVWKMIWLIFRFHVSLPGSNRPIGYLRLCLQRAIFLFGVVTGAYHIDTQLNPMSIWYLQAW